MNTLSEQKIDFAASGDNVVIAAQTNRSILLYRLFFVVHGQVVVRFLDGESGDDFTGPITLNNSATFVLDTPRDEQPWFKTTLGNAFVLNLSAPVQISGRAYFHRQQE